MVESTNSPWISFSELREKLGITRDRVEAMSEGLTVENETIRCISELLFGDFSRTAPF